MSSTEDNVYFECISCHKVWKRHLWSKEILYRSNMIDQAVRDVMDELRAWRVADGPYLYEVMAPKIRERFKELCNA
jgi:hypothetical protein